MKIWHKLLWKLCNAFQNANCIFFLWNLLCSLARECIVLDRRLSEFDVLVLYIFRHYVSDFHHHKERMAHHNLKNGLELHKSPKFVSTSTNAGLSKNMGFPPKISHIDRSTIRKLESVICMPPNLGI